MVKKNMTKKDESSRRLLVLSSKRRSKYSESVKALPVTSVKLRNRLATNTQFKQEPITSPRAHQKGSDRPVAKAKPGNPIKSHPLISEAYALMAVTHAPRVLPPST